MAFSLSWSRSTLPSCSLSSWFSRASTVWWLCSEMPLASASCRSPRERRGYARDPRPPLGVRAAPDTGRASAESETA